MAYIFKTYRNDTRIVGLQYLQVSYLSVIPTKFYESPKLKKWMCELCTFSQIWSYCTCVISYNGIQTNTFTSIFRHCLVWLYLQYSTYVSKLNYNFVYLHSYTLSRNTGSSNVHFMVYTILTAMCICTHNPSTGSHRVVWGSILG